MYYVLFTTDFDECTDAKFHDCSENAQCFNLRGTYTCSCTEGFTDLSHNALFPGRVCSGKYLLVERTTNLRMLLGTGVTNIP